jgi:hypothetical protein
LRRFSEPDGKIDEHPLPRWQRRRARVHFNRGYEIIVTCERTESLSVITNSIVTVIERRYGDRDHLAVDA